ncbi:hypothetical protein ACS0TY_014083 [Phlomoides rotata]
MISYVYIHLELRLGNLGSYILQLPQSKNHSQRLIDEAAINLVTIGFHFMDWSLGIPLILNSGIHWRFISHTFFIGYRVIILGRTFSVESKLWEQK